MNMSQFHEDHLIGEFAIAESKKKIYTIPEGEYDGTWTGYFVWLHNVDNEIIARFQTAHGLKGSAKVRVIIKGTKAKIYEKKKIKNNTKN